MTTHAATALHQLNSAPAAQLTAKEDLTRNPTLAYAMMGTLIQAKPLAQLATIVVAPVVAAQPNV